MIRRVKAGPPPRGLATGAFIAQIQAQGTAFTYQGRLNDNGVPASGTYDLRFTAYDSGSGAGTSDPAAPVLEDYVSTRTLASPFNFATGGDLGPEGVAFISADDSPTGKPLLAVAHEVSGSVAIFQINRTAARRNP